MITLEQWRRQVDADIREIEDAIGRAVGVLRSAPETASLEPNTVELVKVADFDQWENTGVSLSFSSDSGHVLVKVSAACYANNVKSVLGYRILVDGGVAVGYDSSRGVINDRRSPHSEFDRIKNGLYAQAHSLFRDSSYVLELWMLTESNGVLFGDEEARISAITATVEELT